MKLSRRLAGWIGFVCLISAIHLKFHPEDARLNQHTIAPWLALNVRNNLAGIFMYVPPLFPAIILGMMFANFCVICIPPARRAIESEDRQFLARNPGERPLDCKTATKDFLRLLAVLLPSSLIVSLVAAAL